MLNFKTWMRRSPWLTLVCLAGLGLWAPVEAQDSDRFDTDLSIPNYNCTKANAGANSPVICRSRVGGPTRIFRPTQDINGETLYRESNRSGIFLPRPLVTVQPLPTPVIERPFFPSTSASITLYDDINFGGASFGASGPVPSFAIFGFDNRISSFVISEGTWQLCEGPGYTGRCRVVGPGRYSRTENAGLSNDQISSVRPWQSWTN